jgi:HAD superfamily hydrolase (TIGR01509 family)
MQERLPTGKVPWDLVAASIQQVLPPEVRLGPAAGEDAALVELGGELWAVASDPISFTAAEAGRLAVIVNANDVAVRGARPRYFLAVVLVAPEEATPGRVEELLQQIAETCRQLDVALLGGHTEVTPGLPHSLVVGTMLGLVVGEPIRTGGLEPGDRVGMTGWAGLEGTAIVLAEHGERLRARYGEAWFRDLDELLGGDWLLVVPEALRAAAVPGVTALHDVTEGGVGEALHELARASGVAITSARERIPVRPETAQCCRDLGIDPLGLIGSGALLVGCRPDAAPALEQALVGTPFTWIGEATAGVPTSSLPRFPRDELLRAFLLADLEAVVFDLDGTLVETEYDWQAIREELGVSGGSIIDDLHALPEPRRTERWQTLASIEAQATAGARLCRGVPELLQALRRRGLRLALVTNNSEENARALVERFDLRFDVVLSRDCGLWKPSGAPVAEAIRRLDAAPARTLAVGDSRYDLRAGRAAGCSAVCILGDDAGAAGESADLHFPDVPALTRYIELVL